VGGIDTSVVSPEKTTKTAIAVVPDFLSGSTTSLRALVPVDLVQMYYLYVCWGDDKMAEVVPICWRIQLEIIV